MSSGKLTLTIQLPSDITSYYGVTFSDLRVYLVGLPETANGGSNIAIDMVNMGSSTFLDEQGATKTFTHDRTDPAYRVLYDPATCQPRASAFSDSSQPYIRVSPYASWELTVQQPEALDLALVTAVRFEFFLEAQPGAFGGTAVFFVDADDSRHDSEGPDAPNACHASDVCPSCSSEAELSACTTAVNDECCNEPSEDCSSGEPATCNAGCARVLLPVQARCDEWLTADQSGLGAFMKPLLDTAAANCQAPPPPPPTCGQFAEYSALVSGSSALYAACCSSGSSACTPAGMPSDSCSPACATQVNAAYAACTEFLAGPIG
jgi:hypothetical protein